MDHTSDNCKLITALDTRLMNNENMIAKMMTNRNFLQLLKKSKESIYVSLTNDNNLVTRLRF